MSQKRQIEVARALGAKGYCLFSFTQIFPSPSHESRKDVSSRNLRAALRATLDYPRSLPAGGLRARLSVVVYPDAFYTRFYEALLAGGAGRGEAAIREALAASRRSVFTVFEREVPLT